MRKIQSLVAITFLLLGLFFVYHCSIHAKDNVDIILTTILIVGTSFISLYCIGYYRNYNEPTKLRIMKKHYLFNCNTEIYIKYEVQKYYKKDNYFLFFILPNSKYIWETISNYEYDQESYATLESAKGSFEKIIEKYRVMKTPLELPVDEVIDEIIIADIK